MRVCKVFIVCVILFGSGLCYGKKDCDYDCQCKKIKDGYAFVEAAAEVQVRIIEDFLQEKRIVHPDSARSIGGYTALAVASAHGQHKVVAKLLSAGADPNLLCEDEAPIMWAVMKGHYKSFKLLLENKKTDVTVTDRDGWTLLMWAAKLNLIDVVKDLLKDGRVDLNAKSRYGGRTAFTLSVANGNVEIVKEILKYMNIEDICNFDIPSLNGLRSLLFGENTLEVDIIKEFQTGINDRDDLKNLLDCEAVFLAYTQKMQAQRTCKNRNRRRGNYNHDNCLNTGSEYSEIINAVLLALATDKKIEFDKNDESSWINEEDVLGKL